MRYADDEKTIGFYEREFYIFSNFSAFSIEWRSERWMTSEHAYQAAKFDNPALKKEIQNARSAHDAMKIAHEHKGEIQSDRVNTKLSVMEDILRAKLAQHSYVMKKLVESKGKTLVEDSWRDSYWGWGPNHNGENHLGKLWMKIRDELPS